MVEANQSYHPQIVRTIIALALFEARKEIKRKIQSEGRVKLSRVPARDITAMAKALVMERPWPLPQRALSACMLRSNPVSRQTALRWRVACVG